ncbi:MAG: AMP-binding protein, partial [Clostridia bacterium]
MMALKKIKFYKNYEVTDLKDMLFKTAARNAKLIAFRIKDSTGKIIAITYDKFKKDVVALGTKLINMNMTGKKIAISGKNSYNWAVSYMASAIVGIVVPIDKELGGADIVNFLNVSETSLIFADDKILKKLHECEDILNNKFTKYVDMTSLHTDIDFDVFLSDGESILDSGDTEFENIKINPDEMRILLFTSGTTGNSKAVCLSHKNVCSNIMSVAAVVKADKSVSVLSILPLHHTYECTLGFLFVIYGGGSIAYCEGLRQISKNMKEYSPSVLLSVPLLLESIQRLIIKNMEKSLPAKYTKDQENMIANLPFFLRFIVKRKVKKSLGGKMKTFIVGASATDPKLIRNFKLLGMRALQGYGLTECSPLVAGNNYFYMNPDSCGMPIPNVEYKIFDPNAEGVGEIIVRGPNVMLGYYKDEESTKAVLRDGWFHTGDLGCMDKDKFLFITGRCKNVIITKNGKNIYPEELEYYLSESGVVAESLVLGVERDEDGETCVCAKIFPDIERIKSVLKKCAPTDDEIYQAVSDAV